MKYKNRELNEGPLDSVKRFTNAFFDALKANAADVMIQKAMERRMRQDVIDKMEKIRREKEELEQILAKIPKAKVN